MTIDPDEIRESLRRAGARRTRAEDARDTAMAEITKLLRAGDDAGLERKEMAALAGISRTTVYTLLDLDN